jgi:hypothetical protein
MALSDIQLITKTRYKNTVEEQHLYLKELEQSRYLMRYWENLRDLFGLHLPKDFELDGISKLNIQFGDFEGPKYQSLGKDSIAVFKRNDFHFDEFCQLSEKEKDLKSLFYIEDSLINICNGLEFSDDKTIQIKQIAEDIKKKNFEFTRNYKKTSKWNSSRTLRAITTLHHRKGGIDADLEIIDKTGKVIFSEKIVDGRFWEAVWFDLWRGYWEGQKFRIENRVGEDFYCTEDMTKVVI